MPTYNFRAKKGPGDIIDSKIVASSREDAVEKIHQMGYIPVRVVQAQAESQTKSQTTGFFQNSVKSKQVTVFTRQLSILLKSGVPILKSLTVLSEQSLNNYFQCMLADIRSQIKDGKKLSTALLTYPRIFSPLYISLVQAGEESGTLEETLLRIAEYRAKQEYLISSIRTALTYPLLMGIVGVSTIIFMLTFVMPRLLKIFTRLGQELPLPTKILIAISEFLSKWWVWVIIGAITGIVLVFFKRARSKRELLFIGRLMMRLPLFGGIFLKAEMARFSRVLELLLKSGIQLLKAINISIPVLDNEVIRDELRLAYKLVEQGSSLGAILNKSNIFPKFMVNLISVGEESGRMETALQELALTYENETDEAVKIMTNLLEPTIILVMGLIIGFIIVAMLLPVFQLNIMVA